MSKKRNESPLVTMKNKLSELLRDNDIHIVPDDMPSKFEKHGDLVLLPSSCLQNDVWTNLGSKVWDVVAESLKCQRVARKHRIKNDDFRSPGTELLKGSDGVVCHVENGIKVTFDVTKCMFSSGNISEKLRISKFNCQGETVVDMYAGIGYFTLPYLVHAKASLVYACEWNPHAVEALKKNLELNKVASRCIVHQGDNKLVCPHGVADRVNLGLIPSSEDGWETACRALKVTVGGVLHIHGVVGSIPQNISKELSEKEENKEYISMKLHAGKKEWLDWAHNTCDVLRSIFKRIHNQEWTVTVLHIEKVKSYAPRMDHLVLDVKCKPPFD